MALSLTVLLYAIWSSMFPLGKMALAYAPPIFLTGARMLLAAAILLGFVFFKNRSALRLSRKQIFSLFFLGFFSVYLTNICEFWGLRYLTAAKTCFIYSLSPFFAALFSYIHFKEKMTPSKWLGLLIGFLGIIPVLMTQSGSEGLFKAVGFISWPEIAIMGAALFSVYGWVILRLVVKDEATTPTVANGISMLFGGCLALYHSFFIESWAPLPVALSDIPSLLRLLLIMTFLSNVLCYNLYGHLLKRFTATLLSFVGLLSPIFASISSWVLLGEKPSWLIFLSTGVIATGLWIVYRAELKQGYIKKEAPLA